jgi:predicted nucleic acid-binding protein
MAPGLWPYEVANMLALAERRGRMTADQVWRAARWLEALQVRVEPAHPMRAIPGLTAVAREHGLSAYDAAYLDLAARTRSHLATLDGALRQSAARAGVDVFDA